MTLERFESWSNDPATMTRVLSELSRRSEMLYGVTTKVPTTFELFVPSETNDRGAIANIPEGSAIIGLPDSRTIEGGVTLYVEEPGDGLSGPRTFADRVLAAVGYSFASILGDSSPALVVSRERLVLVGTFAPGLPKANLSLDSEAHLAKWLGGSEGVVPSCELEESDSWRAEYDPPADLN